MVKLRAIIYSTISYSINNFVYNIGVVHLPDLLEWTRFATIYQVVWFQESQALAYYTV